MDLLRSLPVWLQKSATVASLDVVVMGAGRLGQSLSSGADPPLARHGLRVVGLFDSDPAKIGTQVGGVVVEDPEALPLRVRQRGVCRAILAVSAPNAQLAAEQLVEAGVRVILSYTGAVVSLPRAVLVERVDPSLFGAFLAGRSPLSAVIASGQDEALRRFAQDPPPAPAPRVAPQGSGSAQAWLQSVLGSSWQHQPPQHQQQLSWLLEALDARSARHRDAGSPDSFFGFIQRERLRQQEQEEQQQQQQQRRRRQQQQHGQSPALLRHRARQAPLELPRPQPEEAVLVVSPVQQQQQGQHRSPAHAAARHELENEHEHEKRQKQKLAPAQEQAPAQAQAAGEAALASALRRLRTPSPHARDVAPPGMRAAPGAAAGLGGREASSASATMAPRPSSAPSPGNMSGWLVREPPAARLCDLSGLEGSIATLQRSLVPGPGGRFAFSGVLLYGAPGSGKSALADAMVAELFSLHAFFAVSAADLLAPARIQRLFGAAARAAPRGPGLGPGRPATAVICLDALDVLCKSDALKLALLREMDRAPPSLLVIASTNLPWEIDMSVLRHFERRVAVPLPDERARARILSRALRRAQAGEAVAEPGEGEGEGEGSRLLESSSQLSRVARATHGYSASDLIVVVKDALGAAQSPEQLDLVKSVSHVRPSISDDIARLYANFALKCGHDSPCLVGARAGSSALRPPYLNLYL
jgi:hypothetical protein